MLTPLTLITFTQQATATYPDRAAVYVLDFVTDGEISTSWDQMTGTAKLTIPKNLYIQDDKGNVISWQGRNIVAGTGSPLLLRGDKVKIELCYLWRDGDGNELIEMNTEFEGYIAGINPRIPVEIKCEDNMYLLKQKRVIDKVWRGPTYTIESMIEEMIDGTGFTIRTDAFATSLGEVRTMNATVAQVLEILKKDYKVQVYFRGNELRVGAIVYWPEDRREYVFEFQENIIDDSLEYTRKDDIRICVKAFSILEEELQTTNFDGSPKTTKTRLEATVGDADGEVRTLYFWNVTTVEELERLATERLTRIYYEGFRGKFKTFGLPSLQIGDGAVLRDNVIPERSGTYLVKGIKKNFGTDGFKQEPVIDLRIDQLSEAEVSMGL